MRYEGHTRFKGNTSEDFGRYRDTADSYPRLLAEDEKLGFVQKPFDWNSGHPAFLYNMYQLLNGIQAMKLEPGATIIEVGSGAGWATEILACLKYRVVCVEPSDVMIEAAKKRVVNFLNLHSMPELENSVAYHCATLEELDIGENVADAVLFFESFHHIIDERLALEKVSEFLKTDGVLCILGDSNWIPGYREQEEFWEEEMRRFGTLESPFTHTYLTELLKHQGFGSVTRHHSVNGLIPVGDENRPVAEFAGPLHATYVNLITAKNVKGKSQCEQDLSADIPAVEENGEISNMIGETHAVEIAITPDPGIKRGESNMVAFASLVKRFCPGLLTPALAWIWRSFLRAN